jgi:hypothetical protein
MNPKYFGDSYDLVKRFFCRELSALGYRVVADPMFTGEWEGSEEAFLRFIGTRRAARGSRTTGRTALFVDPDTGVHSRASRKHVAISDLAERASRYALVFAFDQSFSRQHDPRKTIRGKLSVLSTLRREAMYYDSHARFLFVSASKRPIDELRRHLMQLGLPASRFVTARS